MTWEKGRRLNSFVNNTYTYNANGISSSKTIKDVIARVNPFRYRGYYYDQDIGLYYLQSRCYDPSLGRFINEDSVIGINNHALFSYCGSDPTNRCDATGKAWIKVKNFVSKTIRKLDSFFIKCGINTTVVGANLLDMEKIGNTYHAKTDCWQQYFGYNNFYDFVFWLGTDMVRNKFPFDYNNKKYIIWVWKGDYINLGAGAELGIYYGGEPHWKVDKKLAMYMTLKVYYKNKCIISYSKRTWWITGFNPSYMNKKVKDLKVYYTVKFSKLSLYNAFKRCHYKGWSFNNKYNYASYSF